MAKGDIEIDTQEFRDAIDFVLQVRKKRVPDYLNKKSLMVVVGGKGVKGAIQRTPRADKAKIEAVDVRKVAGAVAARLRRKGKKVTAQEFKDLVKKEYKRRKSSIAYTAGPGWHKAAVAFGGRGVRVQKGFGKSEARKGKGKKATGSNFESLLLNTAPAAGEVGEEALQAAIDDVTRDMIEYGINELLQPLLDEIKPR